VLAVAGTAVPAIYFFGENMEKAHEASVVKGMDGLAMIIDDHKKQAADVASAMAGYPAWRRRSRRRTPPRWCGLLGPMAKQFGVDSVTVSDEKGVVVARTRDKKAGDSVANQVIVQKALQGEATAGVEPGTVVRLSVRAGAPVKNAAGKIVGVVMPSFAVTHNDIVDRVKKLYGTDATLFHGDERVSTTIIKDGKRQVGTKLNEQIAAKVLGERQRYVGRTEILGMQYLTAYMPLKGPDGKPIGVIFAGQNITEMLQERNNMMMVIGAAAFVTIALGVLLALLLARGIAGPIGELAEG
jgi:methyl-accepting chemotaxis protein